MFGGFRDYLVEYEITLVASVLEARVVAFYDAGGINAVFRDNGPSGSQVAIVYPIQLTVGTRGFNLSYLEDLGQVTESRLALYDVVLVYGGHEEGEAPADLVGWVKGGGGLVALHGAIGSLKFSR